MSLPRVDCRTKISEDADELLEAEAQARGIQKAEVARQVIEGWAIERIHVATVLGRLRRREGAEGRARE